MQAKKVRAFFVKGSTGMAFCSGSKGCPRMKEEMAKAEDACDNCYVPDDPNMKMHEVVARLERGDA